jgi:hypothetical protein
MSAVLPSQGVGRSRASGVRRLLVVAAFVAMFAILAIGVYALVHKPKLNMADPKSWMPKQVASQPVDRTVVGTVQAPALTVAGDNVVVKTPTFSAMATVTGPFVPGEGLTFQASYTTCTWTVHIWNVTGRVPLAINDFDVIDHTGQAYQPSLVPGQQMPSALTTGLGATFQVRAVMAVGEGLVRWAPDGDHIVAKWDNQVEND